jgi:hypothetical protein
VCCGRLGASFGSDEGGESGGLPVRVQSKVVMKSRTRIGIFVTDTVILAWQTMAQELLFHRHRLHRSSGCTTCKTVPSPLRTPDRLSEPTV